MPDSLISGLPLVDDLQDSDQVPVVSDGLTKRASVAEIRGSSVSGSRLINTTAPLAGGGDLSADRTLTISAASGGSAGSMSAAHYTKLEGIEAAADVTDAANVAAAGAVMVGRSINTTAPLTGGGDLSTDRTLAISAASDVAAGSMSAAHYTKLEALDVRPVIVTTPDTALSLGDNQHGQIIFCSAGTPIDAALLSGSPGTSFELIAEGAGQIIVTFAGGVIYVPPSFGPNTKEQYSSLVVTYKNATTVVVRGDLGPP